jgi:hypothetical protein
MLVLPWLIAIVFAASDEYVMTRLLRREYADHRLTWEADGKPRSIVWVPDECKIGRWHVTYASGHAGQRARLKWLFKMPNWMSNDAEARRLLVFHRILLPAFIACAIAPFVIAALFQ